ncbi:Arc family DNA-binding protein [Xanthobacter autotrophicus]|uniref:Arc family DNA-binding protein n=1 Tax=Xanthobacter autotrophicus TaxID=280 RepID=UPI003727F5B7
MTREDPQMKLRLPPDLKQRISEAAVANNRSLNAEIVGRLEWSFDPHAGAKFLTVGRETITVEQFIKSVAAELSREMGEKNPLKHLK